MYIGVYVYAYIHIMWDVCMCEEKERRTEKEREREMCVSACMCVHTIPLFDPGIHRRQNKNHTPAASRQSEIYLHSLLSPGR